MNHDARDDFGVASSDEYAAAILDAAVDNRADATLFHEMIDEHGPESLFNAMRVWVQRTRVANPEIPAGAASYDIATYYAADRRFVAVDIDTQPPETRLAVQYILAGLRDDAEAAANVMLSVPDDLFLAVVLQVLAVSAQNVRCRARKALDEADTWLTLWGIEQAGMGRP